MDAEKYETIGIINKIKGIRWNEKLWRLEHQVEWEGYENDEYWQPYEDIRTYQKEHGQQKIFNITMKHVPHIALIVNENCLFFILLS